MSTPLSLATSQILISDAGGAPIHFNRSRTCIFWSRIWSAVFIKGFWTRDVPLTFQKRPVVQISSCRISGKLLCSCFRASPNTEPAVLPSSVTCTYRIMKTLNSLIDRALQKRCTAKNNYCNIVANPILGWNSLFICRLRSTPGLQTNCEWLLQVHKHAWCPKKLSATAPGSSGPAVCTCSWQLPRCSGSGWNSGRSCLHPSLNSTHPRAGSVIGRSQTWLPGPPQLGVTHSLFVARGNIWPQGPHQPPLLLPLPSLP